MAQDLPCARCGKVMYRNPRHSLPSGSATCQPCRRELRELKPSEAWPERETDCAVCGATFVGRHPKAKYCGEKCKRSHAPGGSPSRTLATIRAARKLASPTARVCSACGADFESKGNRRRCVPCSTLGLVGYATCEGCGTEFLGRAEQAYCTLSCFNIGGQRRRDLRICEICEAPYRWTYRQQRTCGRTCGAELQRRSPRRLLCEGCGASFESTGSGARFCRPSCRPRPVPTAVVRSCAECCQPFVGQGCRKYCSPPCAAQAGRRQNLVRYGTTPEHVDSCAACGEPKPVGKRKYCDPCGVAAMREVLRCARRRRRARERSAAHEPYTLAEIAKRDGYKCGLCRRRVRMELVVPHRDAATIDHLVPLSDGGDDTRANVQLAHFLCNSLRGAGGVVQLALVG